MKTTLLLKTTFLLAAFALTTAVTNAQPVPELIFSNPTLQSGTSGADGAVYRFPDVAPNVDGLITITARSSSDVNITNIDLASTGYANAFQPQINYKNGNAPANSNWWIDFDFSFVVKGTSIPTVVTTFNLTALDVDGDGGSLNEFVQFSAPQSYVVENNTLLSVSSLTELIFGILSPVKKFVGPKTNFTDINVNATEVMTTLTYTNKNFFRLRAGGTTANSSTSAADRMYSFWFRGFAYNTPIQNTLPVKLASFSAMLNKSKVDLRWTTSSEINVSHFIVEKSTDGINYTDAGMVFAYGNATDQTNYSFSDNVNINQAAVIYYRLRSVDIDGRSELTEIKIIRIGKQNESGISIVAYPNPATNEVRITIPANWQNKKVAYQLFSANGQPVRTTERANSNQTEAINVSSLAPGLYFVKAICEGQVAQQKIIKQ